uniref:PABS domain-containing protein n=1 Tax=Spongospora subterranea TaxID=70186 RepID=A0A0H5R245_9EUKA|eukprot:CRZ01924.1 hypothetical protein [Spongospora subterranea]
MISKWVDSETMTNLYTQDAFEMMKNLMTPGGVVVINFVGFTSGKGSEMSAFIKKTLLNVFHNVACYSDGDPNELSANAVNLVQILLTFLCIKLTDFRRFQMFFCSDESDMSFRVPTMRAIEAETPDWILDQFQTWRVHSFSSETTAPTKTTSNWTPTLKLIRQDISDQVQGYLPHDSWSS